MYLGQTNWGNIGFSSAELGTTGLVSLGLISTGVGAPVGAALMAGQAILSQLGIRRGATEADAIVPAQNEIGARLKEINAGIPTASIPQLQAWYGELAATAQKFREFVDDPRFTDGRASQQAKNTLMPLIDGTDATGNPCSVNAWGNPCNGGTIGTIIRQLLSLGGQVQPPQLTQGAGVPTLQTPIPGLAYIPQSGYIPPTAPLSPIKSAGIMTISGPGGSSEMLPLLLAGALGLLFFTGGRKQ
jgi:hypothetical protein